MLYAPWEYDKSVYLRKNGACETNLEVRMSYCDAYLDTKQFPRKSNEWLSEYYVRRIWQSS